MTTHDYENDRCDVCGERLGADDVAEMYDPDEPDNESTIWQSFIVHAECGLARGYKIA